MGFRSGPLIPLIKSYTKKSIDVINDLKDLRFPNNAVIFSADAKSMYTNIDTDITIASFQEFFTRNFTKIPTDFPVNLFLEILEKVMKNNIFDFGDTYWQQMSGTAMDPPTACAYATIAFEHFEIPTYLQLSLATYYITNHIYWWRLCNLASLSNKNHRNMGFLQKYSEQLGETWMDHWRAI